jgi:hypothetical protein
LIRAPLSDFSLLTAGSELPSSVPVSLWTTATAPILSPSTDGISCCTPVSLPAVLTAQRSPPGSSPSHITRAAGGTNFPQALPSSSFQDKLAPSGGIYFWSNRELSRDKYSSHFLGCKGVLCVLRGTVTPHGPRVIHNH